MKFVIFTSYRQYNFDPNPDILSLFSNFEDFASDEVSFPTMIILFYFLYQDSIST